jgi:hypothetical protein
MESTVHVDKERKRYGLRTCPLTPLLPASERGNEGYPGKRHETEIKKILPPKLRLQQLLFFTYSSTVGDYYSLKK